MAEVVGLIASIVALAETGFKIARGISRITEEFGQAGAEIKSIGTDTRAIAFILHELQRRLERLQAKQQVEDETREVVTAIVALCKTDIDSIGEFLRGLQSEGTSQIGVSQKTKWLFSKSKISLRQSSLNSLKLTLSLLMHTLDSVECGKIDDYIKEEVGRLVSESKETKVVLIKAEQDDRNIEDHFQRTGLDSLDAHTYLKNDDGPNEAMKAIVLRQNENSDLDSGGLVPRFSGLNIARMEEMDDEDFLHIAEHVRVQRLARDLAIKIVQSVFTYSSHSNGPVPSQVETQLFYFDMIEESERHAHIIRCGRDEADMRSIIKSLAREHLGSTDRDYIENDMWCLTIISRDGRRYPIVAPSLWTNVFKPRSEVVLKLRFDDDYLGSDFPRNPNFTEPFSVRRIGKQGSEKEICLNAYARWWTSQKGQDVSPENEKAALILGSNHKRMLSVLKAWGYTESECEDVTSGMSQ
ncbi:MAG: hypothetical protein M1821_009966 [Bathelium mastoideum]|nr:MAG: hypothetical protein M1821_009966 [Bathelium mastoideum]